MVASCLKRPASPEHLIRSVEKGLFEQLDAPKKEIYVSSTAKQLGMVGLGRMGANMVRRLLRKKHPCVVFNRSPKPVQELVREGATGSDSLANLVKQLDKSRAIWLMVPTAAVDQNIADLLPYLDPGDILIDGGNSYYIDDIRRSKNPASRKIHYVDVGTSGGVWGLDRGYCNKELPNGRQRSTRCAPGTELA